MSLPTLVTGLTARSYAEVRQTATLLGVRRRLPHGPKAAWVDAIADFWRAPARRATAIAEFSPEMRTLLVRLLTLGALPAPLLSGQYGPLRLPTYRQSRLPSAPHSPLERLYWMGLILQQRSPGRTIARFALPSDLTEWLTEWLAPQLPTPPLSLPTPPPTPPAAIPTLLLDMVQYLSFLHQHPHLKLRGGRWLPRRALTALNHRLAHPQAVNAHARHPILAWLAFLASAARLHDRGQISASGWDYLASTPTDQFRRLWQGWSQASDTLRQAYRQPICRFAADWPARWTGILCDLPAAVPFSLDQLTSLLVAEEELAPYLCANFRSLSHLQNDLADTLAQMVRLGVIKPHPVVFQPSALSSQWFQLTGLGAWLLDAATSPAPAWRWSATAATVDMPAKEDSVQVRLPPDALPAAQVRLAGYAHGGRAVGGLRRYRLTRGSVAHAAAQGRGLPDLLDALHSLGATPGVEMAALLRAWHEAGWALQLSIAPLLRTNDAQLMARLIARPELAGWIGPRLSATSALWRGDLQRFLAKLRAAGFYPNITAIPAGEADTSLEAGETGALWLAGQLMVLLGRHLPLPMPPSVRTLQRLYSALQPQEQATLQAALREAENKLAALLDGQVFTPPPAPSDPARWRPQLEVAIEAGQTLEMVYFSPARNLPTRRTIRPGWLVERNGILYVEAECLEAGELLTFRLDRILALVPI